MGLNRYQITEKDIRTIEQYLRILQSHLKIENTWDELTSYAGFYGTSIAIHEIVEIRALRARGIEPLDYRKKALQAILQQRIDAHVLAIYEEHLYLQEVMLRQFGTNFQVATIIQANRPDNTDLDLFLESDIGVYILEEERVTEAEDLLTQLKGMTL